MLFDDTWSHVVKYKCLREEATALPQPSPTISNQQLNKYGKDLASRQRQKNQIGAVITPVLPNPFNISNTSSLTHVLFSDLNRLVLLSYPLTYLPQWDQKTYANGGIFYYYYFFFFYFFLLERSASVGGGV